DGTSNFANAVPTYGVMMGLLEGDKPIAGGIALPSFNEVYVGAPGHGATCNGDPIHVSTETQLLSSLVVYEIDGHQEQPDLTYSEANIIARIVLGIRNLRSSNSAFDAALIARGAYGAGMNQTSKIWDNVAQQAVIEAAGGTYTDFWGKPIDYSKPLTKAEANFTGCYGAPALHRAIQQIVHQG
ncbi:MAG TPA: inositol monophosphatase family protein, partial [Candidatus Saccharimonadia bacterium]|nr:inositol monophosphatase family protein [Candidatus Saccharimonadia bacterium]